MATKKAKIIKTKRKGKDVLVLDLGTVRKEKLYTSEWRAAVGAVRHYRDWCKVHPLDNVVEITYPDGRKRDGSMWPSGRIYLSQLSKPKTTKSK